MALEIDLDDVFQKIHDNLFELIQERNVSLHIDPLPLIHGYPSDIYLLFQNIIQNTIKFTPQDRKPEIHVSCLRKSNSYLISIRDNGIGIKKEHQSAIFKVFQRVSSDYEGTGIGLAISKKIVDHHGGRIYMNSEYGKGTTFFVELPDKRITSCFYHIKSFLSKDLAMYCDSYIVKTIFQFWRKSSLVILV